MDKTGLTNFVLAMNKLVNKSAANTIAAVSDQEIKAGIDQMFTQYESAQKDGVKISFDIYIDKFSKVPVKIGVSVDASGSAQLKQSGADTLTVAADATYDFPATASIVEPTSYISMMELIMKASAAFAPQQAAVPASQFPAVPTKVTNTPSRVR